MCRRGSALLRITPEQWAVAGTKHSIPEDAVTPAGEAEKEVRLWGKSGGFCRFSLYEGNFPVLRMDIHLPYFSFLLSCYASHFTPSTLK